MGRPLRLQFENALYHITSRGNERNNIYFDDKDKAKFLDLLEEYKTRYNFLIHCYALMDNHYHIVIETLNPNLVKIMHGLNSSYTGYFNRRYKRSGHLFQGRYKAIVVDKENYLLELSRYVHLNPVRAGMVGNPREYRWSGYRSYIQNKGTDSFVDSAWILSIFHNQGKISKEEYKKFVEDGIGKKIETPLRLAVGKMILGTREFIDRVIALVDKSGQRYDLLKKTGVVMTANPELVVNMVGIEYKKTPKDIVTTGERKNEARNVAIYIIRKHCELSNREIAEMFGGLKESAISKVVKRMEQKLRINKELERRINKLVSNVKA